MTCNVADNRQLDAFHARRDNRKHHDIHKYIFLKSVAAVIRLQLGHSFVDPRHRSQHSRQQVCQHPVETVGSVYGSKQIRQSSEVEDDTRMDSLFTHENRGNINVNGSRKKNSPAALFYSRVQRSKTTRFLAFVQPIQQDPSCQHLPIP